MGSDERFEQNITNHRKHLVEKDDLLITGVKEFEQKWLLRMSGSTLEAVIV